VPPPAAALTPRSAYARPIDAIPVVLDVPVVELYALRLSDRFDEDAWAAEGIPHLARGLSGPARVAELRESVLARLRAGMPAFQTPVEVDFGPNKAGPYVQDGHHRLGIALELGVRAAPVQVPRGIAQSLGWLDLAARRFAADRGTAGQTEYHVFRSVDGEPGLTWAARCQRLAEVGEHAEPAVILGRYATQAEAMYACELDANGRVAADWSRGRSGSPGSGARNRSTEGVCRRMATRCR
jgi:hypothetical protein